jgi:putative OPT family oligopeptide transporter
VNATTLPSEPPATSSNASPEQKDRQWFEQTYQGDHQRQLTVRAVITGGVLGMFMSLSNLYTTLKLGWSFGVAITACVLSFVIWNAVRALSGGRLTPMSLLENNCMQSTASAAGYSTGSTVGTAFGALLLLTGVHQPWYVVTPVVLLTAALGVFLAVPMKRQLINHEQLPFPSGIAAAETLRSLYAHGVTALHKAWSLIGALVVGGIVGLLRTAGTLAEQLRLAKHPQVWMEKLLQVAGIPEAIALTALNPVSGITLAGLSFEPSVLLLGAGMIVGLRVSLSMLLSSALLYFVLVPQLVAFDAAHPELVPSLVVKGGMINPVRWALWGGTSIMLFSSLTSLALQWRTLLGAFKIRRRTNGAQDPLAEIEVPGSWLVAGLIPITIGLVLVQWLAFHIALPLGVFSVLLSVVAALVCCRATGETDTTPIGPMGKLTQLIFATLPGAAGNTSINLMSAGITAAAGASAADLLTDLKSGYLLGANPRRQFIAQFLGVFFGTLAVVPAWYALVPNKAALEAYNPPAANMWKAVTDLLTQGVHMLPRTAMLAIVIGAFIGTLLPLADRWLPRVRNYLPSAMGLGLGLVIPFQNSLSFALGALVAFAWTKFSARNAETFSIPVASGFVAGESLIAAVIAILCSVVGLLAAK